MSSSRSPIALDEQQMLLLEVLGRAGGAPVSYQQLRDAGVEYPASVAAELQLAGVSLERSYGGDATARRLLGLRLDPYRARPDEAREVEVAEGHGTTGPRRAQPLSGRLDSAAVADTLAAGARSVAGAAGALVGRAGTWVATKRRVWRPPRRAPSGANAARWIAPVALLATATLLAVLIAGALSGARHRRHLAAPAGPRANPSAAARSRPASTPPRRAPSGAAVPVSPALAERLEARGHALLQAGELTAALPILRQALAATGEKLDGCLEPSSETCLTYAYALYDLGRALRLDRQAGAAVPILEHRLQIANQRPTVQAELELARRQAGRAPAGVGVSG